jgi:hypothetical protein
MRVAAQSLMRIKFLTGLCALCYSVARLRRLLAVSSGIDFVGAPSFLRGNQTKFNKQIPPARDRSPPGVSR